MGLTPSWAAEFFKIFSASDGFIIDNDEGLLKVPYIACVCVDSVVLTTPILCALLFFSKCYFLKLYSLSLFRIL